jgi:hypothetical protein
MERHERRPAALEVTRTPEILSPGAHRRVAGSGAWPASEGAAISTPTAEPCDLPFALLLVVAAAGLVLALVQDGARQASREPRELSSMGQTHQPGWPPGGVQGSGVVKRARSRGDRPKESGSRPVRGFRMAPRTPILVEGRV